MPNDNKGNLNNQVSSNSSNNNNAIQNKPSFIQKPIKMTMLDNSLPMDKSETKLIKPKK